MTACCDKPGRRYHAPDFVLKAQSSCDKSREWLDRVTKSARNASPARDIKHLIHRAVSDQGEYDFYTGNPIKWTRINHEKSPKTGSASHNSRGEYPSVDHYEGVKKPDFRICSATVNWAKGSLPHTKFVELCTDVVSHAGKTGLNRKRSFVKT